MRLAQGEKYVKQAQHGQQGADKSPVRHNHRLNKVELFRGVASVVLFCCSVTGFIFGVWGESRCNLTIVLAGYAAFIDGF